MFPCQLKYLQEGNRTRLKQTITLSSPQTLTNLFLNSLTLSFHSAFKGPYTQVSSRLTVICAFPPGLCRAYPATEDVQKKNRH